MLTPARRLLACLAVLAALTGASSGADDARAPVPDAAARAPAVAELRKEIGEKLKSKDPEAKRTLARELLDRAAPPELDAVKRFVLLDQAASLAEDVRDVRLALDAVGRLAGAFQVEGPARSLAAMDAIARGSKDAALVAETANACVEVAGAALAADDAATAGKALSSARTLAKSVKLGGLDARAAQAADLVAAFRRESVAAEAARTALAAAPDDPAANEALGRFLCFGRTQWDEGFAHLAKSGAGALATVAATELKHPADAALRQEVADSWWDLAQKEKDPLARARMLARAAAAYEASPADAPADRVALVKKRLDAITWSCWDRGVALTKDFGKDGPTSLALATIRAFIAKQGIDTKSDEWRTKLPRFPDVAFGRGEEYLWHLATNQGAITLRFFADTAPKHVANFLYLTELGFFDGLIFHRVVPGFMAQGGCPKKTGGGNPGYFIETEFIGDHRHDKAGVLSMANTGQPKSDGSQFFILFAPASHLDGKHTIFGEVIDGMDVVKKLEAQGTPDPGVPKIPLVINAATVSVR